MSTFVCTKCGLEKLVELFPKKGKQCKVCIAEINKAYVQQNRQRIQARKNAWQQIKRAEIKAQNLSVLSPLQQAKLQCKTRYFTGEPCPNGHIADRLVSSRACVVCAKEKFEAYKKTNRDLYLLNKRKFAKAQRKANPEHVRAIAKKTYANRTNERKQQDLLNAKKWRDNNKERILAWTRARQADKLKRTPAWLTDDDRWMIEQAYELAALRTQMFGFPWHVDHVLPLRGKNVSGLHVPTNLQVIPGVENLRKGNRV